MHVYCHKIHNTKFTVLSGSQCTALGPEVHSRGCAAVTTFPSSQTDIPPHPSLPAPAAAALLSVSVIWVTVDSYISEMIQCLSFCDWFISLSISLPNLQPVLKSPSFSRLNNNLLCLYHTLFIYSCRNSMFNFMRNCHTPLIYLFFTNENDNSNSF